MTAVFDGTVAYTDQMHIGLSNCDTDVNGFIR